MNGIVKITALSAAFFLFLSASGRAVAASPEGREDRLRSDVTFLCDSVCRGRAMYSIGGTEAAMHIIRRLNAIGLNTEIQSFEAGGKVGHNIIAAVKGSSSSSYVLVTAYYDGLGELGGKTYPGADANASGTAGLLELARALIGSGRNIVFAALDGHNASLSGANALKTRLSSVRPSLVVNLDIIGSDLSPVHSYWKEYFLLVGGERLSQSIEKCNSGLGLHLYYDYYGSRDFTTLFYRKIGDQKVFLEQGIPCIMATSGITMLTNKEEDLPDSLNYGLLAKRIELLARWLGSFRPSTSL